MPQSAPPPVGLAPGDQLTVSMPDFPDASSAPLPLRVGPDGALHVPFAGTIPAQGLSPDQVETEINAALRSRQIVRDPHATVNLVASSSYIAQVVGEVKTPGPVPLFGPQPLVNVLGLAGGLTGLTSHHVLLIHHSAAAPTPVDFDPDAPSAAAYNTLVQPGDIVNVSRIGNVYILGEVNHPGVYPLSGILSATNGAGTYANIKHLTMFQALTLAGGVTVIAWLSHARILRTVDGHREEITVDIGKLQKGLVDDPVLHADDILYVPRSAVRQVTSNFYGNALSALYAIHTYTPNAVVD